MIGFLKVDFARSARPCGWAVFAAHQRPPDLLAAPVSWLRDPALRMVSVATEIRVIPAESSGSPDQVFDGLGSAGYGGSKDAGWSWTSTPPTDRLSETDTLI